MEIYAFFDVDRTIRTGSAALDFCKFLAEKGIVEDEFIERDSEVREQYKKGFIDYQKMVDGVVTIHGSVLNGLDADSLTLHYEEFVKKPGSFFSWTETLFEQLENMGVKTVLVSAGIYPAIDAIARHLKVDKIFTSQLEKINNAYTGKVTRILHDDDKREVIEQYLKESIDSVYSIGFGDSTGDVSMLQLMDHVFVFDPHQQEMITIAKENNWDLFTDGSQMLSKVKMVLEKVNKS